MWHSPYKRHSFTCTSYPEKMALQTCQAGNMSWDDQWLVHYQNYVWHPHLHASFKMAAITESRNSFKWQKRIGWNLKFDIYAPTYFVNLLIDWLVLNTNFSSISAIPWHFFLWSIEGRYGRDRMVFGLQLPMQWVPITTNGVSSNPLMRDLFDSVLGDKVCQ